MLDFGYHFDEEDEVNLIRRFPRRVIVAHFSIRDRVQKNLGFLKKSPTQWVLGFYWVWGFVGFFGFFSLNEQL